MKNRWILGIVSCLACVGCGNEQTVTTKDPVYFLFATPLSTHTLWLQAEDGMNDACDELGIYCDWKGPTSIDTEAMNDIVYTGLLQEADGIITQGVIQPKYINEGMAEEIPFVLVDSGIQGATPLATITKDFTQQAELLLEDIEKTLGEDEKLYIGIQVSELDFDLAKRQIEAVEKVFKRHPGGYKILSVTESGSDKLQSREEWKNVLTEDMNVCLNFAGESAAGCIEAVDSTPIEKEPLVYGVDDMKDTIQLIKKGRIKGSIVTSFYQYGYQAVHLLYDQVVSHKKPEKQNIAAHIMLVNQANLEDYANERK